VPRDDSVDGQRSAAAVSSTVIVPAIVITILECAHRRGDPVLDLRHGRRRRRILVGSTSEPSAFCSHVFTGSSTVIDTGSPSATTL
jgi:hypothetical protein